MTRVFVAYSLIFVCSGIALWLKGYKNPTHVPSDLPYEYLAKLICPPRLFYFLFGMPKSTDYPKGVMSAWAFFVQLGGLSYFIYGSLFLFPKQNLAGSITDLAVITILVYVFSYWLTKNRAYRPRRNRSIK